MPTENFELGAGTLFVVHQDGSYEPLGEVQEMEGVESIPLDATLVSWGPAKEASFTVETSGWEVKALWQLTHDPHLAVLWAKEHRSKLLHLSAHAKKMRDRRKNARRIVREFFEIVGER